MESLSSGQTTIVFACPLPYRRIRDDFIWLIMETNGLILIVVFTNYP